MVHSWPGGSKRDRHTCMLRSRILISRTVLCLLFFFVFWGILVFWYLSLTTATSRAILGRDQRKRPMRSGWCGRDRNVLRRHASILGRYGKLVAPVVVPSDCRNCRIANYCRSGINHQKDFFFLVWVGCCGVSDLFVFFFFFQQTTREARVPVPRSTGPFLSVSLKPAEGARNPPSCACVTTSPPMISPRTKPGTII
jgi:hypothetical protein